ncbi:coniferyl aldehyde dehydrogenase [soil metagenome]
MESAAETKEPESKDVAPAKAEAAEDSKKTEPMKMTTPEELKALFDGMHKASRNGVPSYEERVARLDKLERAILDFKDELVKAISADFGHRCKYESLQADVFLPLSALRHTRDHLHEWMETESRPVIWVMAPATAEIITQPLGVVGIISPWNYPVQLALEPLAQALAAGNRALIKPSEFVPRTAEVLARMCEKHFGPEEVRVVLGGADVGESFSKLAFDHLIFTGSTRVGKAIMRAAAENLVPVTLELGGKSPSIVTDDFPLDVAADRIMFGKLFNAGQTCVSPDYALVPKKDVEKFVDACKESVAKMFPTLAKNDDYSSIVNTKHWERLKGYLEEAKTKGAKVVEINPAKEEFTEESHKLCPTLVLNATDDMALLEDELFGPILPIIPYDKLEDAIEYVNARPRPLALYVFSYDDDATDKVLERTVSGGVCVNDAMLHVAQDDLPFGGVGPSGMGHYHGREGFETFSKRKPIFRQARLNGGALLRPPYGKTIDFALRFLVGK